jgi:hypothetical protein
LTTEGEFATARYLRIRPFFLAATLATAEILSLEKLRVLV